MKLYSARLSLFAKKVEIGLAEKNLPFERILVPFDQTVGYSPKHPDVLAANPKGQIPVLVDGELTLYDSTVILEYLEDAYPAIPLYPRAADARARCRLLDVFADEIMLPPLRALMHRSGPRPADPGKWASLEVDAERTKVTLGGHFSDLEQSLGDREYFSGDLGAADISVFMALLYIRRLGGPGFDAHPALGRWYRRVRARPAFADVAAEIAEADRDLSAPVEGAYPGGD